jgi:Tol biopolymer transport system component
MVVSANGGRERVLYQGPNTPGTLDWSADGKWIYFQSRERDPATGLMARQLMRVSAAGTPTVEIVPHPMPGSFQGFSADGRFAAHAVPYEQPKAIAINDQNGKTLGVFDLPEGMQVVGWSSVGHKLLAFQRGSPSAVFAIDPTTGRARSLSGGWGRDQDARYSPDGQRIALLTVVDGRKKLVLTDAQGRNRRVLQNASEPASAVKWSPDGRYIAFLSNEIYPEFAQLIVVEVSSGRETKLGRMPPTANFAWRKDGKTLVASDPIQPDSTLFVDIDLQGRSTPLARVPGRQRTHRLLGSGPGAEREVPGLVLLDQEWVAVYSVDQIELRNLRDQSAYVVHGGFRGANLNFQHIRGISPDGKTVALYVHEESAAGRKWVTKLVPIRGGEARYINTGMDDGDVGDVVWLPDGRNLAVLGYVYPGATGVGPYMTAEEIPLLHIVPLAGGPWRDLFAATGAQDWWDMPVVSPDGRTILLTGIRNFGGQVVELDFTEALKNVKRP